VLEHDRPANEAVNVWLDFHAGEFVSNQPKPAKNQLCRVGFCLFLQRSVVLLPLKLFVDGVHCG